MPRREETGTISLSRPTGCSQRVASPRGLAGESGKSNLPFTRDANNRRKQRSSNWVWGRVISWLAQLLPPRRTLGYCLVLFAVCSYTVGRSYFLVILWKHDMWQLWKMVYLKFLLLSFYIVWVFVFQEVFLTLVRHVMSPGWASAFSVNSNSICIFTNSPILGVQVP